MQLSRWFRHSKRGISRSVLFAVVSLALCAPLAAQTCPFDDGNSKLTREGLVLTRYALGLTGASLVSGTDFAVADAPTIASTIACPSCGLNITGNVDGGGNPVVTVADATIISRKLAGLSGAALTNGVALGSGSRNSVSAVNSFLLAGCGAGSNAWVNGGNSFGADGQIGTNDDRPLRVVSGGALLSAQLADNGGLRIFRTDNAGVPAVVNGSSINSVGVSPFEAATVAGGGTNSTNCFDAPTNGVRNCGNAALAFWATVSGGFANRSTGDASTIAGGYENSATSLGATVGGGFQNIATGNGATVPGGTGNRALRGGSLAAGTDAIARARGMFVWSDLTQIFDPAALGSFGASIANPEPVSNTFIVQATGGVQFVTGRVPNGGYTASCWMNPGGAGWNCASDRNVKHSVQPVSPAAILNKLINIPISTWAFDGNERRQMGPMSQDFFRAFGLGDSDRAINSVDAQGVAFAAIQGLHQIVKEKNAEIAKLKAEMLAIKKRLGMR